ncbi:darcynin family protein [Chitinophaga sp. HK235]|uniref:darcynin family protein n=1 Tax=Chitinophaga sp. HK235 TaxID=2952571 RepID=UPI001BA4A1CA|nr:darcynin family protein [Chitinophaga sp. HK235]
MNYTIIILINATPQWLTLPRKERDRFVQNEVNPIFDKFADKCKVKLFDSDFTCAGVSDFVIIETGNLEDFGYLMGYLRESKTFAVPYFEVKNIITGVPNNFRGSLDIADITG